MQLTENCNELQEKIDYLINKLTQAINNDKSAALELKEEHTLSNIEVNDKR